MRNGYRIDLTDEAMRNIDSIVEYLENRWTEKEIRLFFKKLDKRIDILSATPHAYPLVDFSLEVRRCVLTEQTTIYYEIKTDSVVILSLFDNRKDPDSRIYEPNH